MGVYGVLVTQVSLKTIDVQHSEDIPLKTMDIRANPILRE